MITLLTGIPRSGKSYYAVHNILEKLTSDKPFLILTNIEGLNVDDARLITQEFDATFFQNTRIAPYLRDLRDKYGLKPEDPIYLYIDEAQRYFNKPDSDTIYFFDYHGHYGVHIWLITQHEKKISFQITCHHEEEIRAAASSTNPFKSFMYKKMQSGDQFGSLRLKREKRVFDAYKSFSAGDGKMPKSNMRYYVAVLVVGGVLFWLLFFKVFAKSFGVGEDKEERPKPTIPAIHREITEVKHSDPVPVVKQNPVKPEVEEKKTEFYGPEILEYSQGRDAVLIKAPGLDLESWVKVKDYIKEYPAMLYGFGYFHAPHKKFVVMSADNGSVIFPVANKLFLRESFVRSEPSSSTLPAPVAAYASGFSGPGQTDKYGYTDMDHRVRRWSELTAAGYSVEYPKQESVTTQTSEQNQQLGDLQKVVDVLTKK
jgi:zona occludens toxin